jgi:hypothetical protein
MLQMTSHPLGQVFEAMIQKRHDQIPDEGFLKTKQLNKYMTLYCTNSTKQNKAKNNFK